jgi:hypothetical protein
VNKAKSLIYGAGTQRVSKREGQNFGPKVDNNNNNNAYTLPK